MDKIEVLKRTNLFESISSENLAALADISIAKDIKKKETLFWEGDKGFSIYLLVEGHIQLYKATPDGKEVVIKVVKPGELFAEAILFESNSYPVTAVALENSRLFMIPKHQFNCLLANESFRKDFLGNLMKKLRYLADQIQDLTSHDVEERLMMFLNEQYGDEKRIIISMSKKDVAAAIGATPETLSRLLLRLKEEQKLTWEGSTIQIT